MQNITTKTAFIAIVGCPNVGKSSLLNKMLGQKVAIVSAKAQTTRTKIMGVLTNGDCQLVFTDTPGYHKPHNKLGESMQRAVSDSIGGVDACLFVVEANGKLKKGELELLESFKSRKLPVVLAINKTDVADKEAVLQKILEATAHYDFAAVVPVSALTGDGLKALLFELEALSSPSVHYFESDTLTDQPERVLAAEMLREKMLMLLDKEVPHGIAVSIEKMKERRSANGDILDIEAIIYCERETHKGIIIGKKGAMLKKISIAARYEMEKFFQIQINLKTWVKVKEDWRNRAGLIHNFGLDN